MLVAALYQRYIVPIDLIFIQFNRSGRYIFGGEPQGAEVLEFIHSNEIDRVLDLTTSIQAIDLPEFTIVR